MLSIDYLSTTNPFKPYSGKIQRILTFTSVEMMGLIGMGNNPMVGATVAVAVAVEEAMKNA